MLFWNVDLTGKYFAAAFVIFCKCLATKLLAGWKGIVHVDVYSNIHTHIQDLIPDVQKTTITPISHAAIRHDVEG